MLQRFPRKGKGVRSKVGLSVSYNYLLFHTHSTLIHRYAGTGGFSEILGWTEVHEAEGQAKLGGTQGVLGFVALILAADVALYGESPPLSQPRV